MTWQSKRDDVAAAIATAPTLFQATGRKLLEEFNAKIREFEFVSYGRLTQPSETAQHVTWRTSTMPNFIMDLFRVAAVIDGEPVGVVDMSNLWNAKNAATSRISKAKKSSGAIQKLANRTLEAPTPSEPKFYPNDYYNEREVQARTKTSPAIKKSPAAVAGELNEMEAEATVWLGLVEA